VIYSACLALTDEKNRRMAARVRPYMMLVFAVPAFLLGGLYAVLGRQYIVSGGDATVFYPAVMLYNYTAEALSTAILLVAGTLAALWIPQALGHRPRAGLNGLAVALALTGTTLACWGTLPNVFAPYLHMGRATLGGHVYQLGVRYAAKNGSVAGNYVFCGCDGSGLFCQCHDLPAAGEPVPARAQLVADPNAGTLTIQVGSQTVYRFQP
jgi:hypothetical protein